MNDLVYRSAGELVAEERSLAVKPGVDGPEATFVIT